MEKLSWISIINFSILSIKQLYGKLGKKVAKPFGFSFFLCLLVWNGTCKQLKSGPNHQREYPKEGN